MIPVLFFSSRKCLAKWGYTASDVKILFEFMDVDGDGNLNLNEFMELFHQNPSRSSVHAFNCRAAFWERQAVTTSFNHIQPWSLVYFWTLSTDKATKTQYIYIYIYTFCLFCFACFSSRPLYAVPIYLNRFSLLSCSLRMRIGITTDSAVDLFQMLLDRFYCKSVREHQNE